MPGRRLRVDPRPEHQQQISAEAHPRAQRARPDPAQRLQLPQRAPRELRPLAAQTRQSPGPLAVLRRVTLPALRGAIAAGAAITLIAILKELPLARLLAPLGDRSLAVTAWAFADEARFADAAPYALTLVLISMCSVAIVLRAGGDTE